MRTVRIPGWCRPRSPLRTVGLASLTLVVAVTLDVGRAQAASWPAERPAGSEVITYGTLGTADETHALRLFALRHATWSGDEAQRVVADRDFKPEHAAKDTVVLVGHPHDHLYFRDLEARLPFLIDSNGALTIADHTFPGPWTLAARFPNPARDGSFVEMYAASDPRFSADVLETYYGDTDYTLRYSAVAPALSANFGDPGPEVEADGLTWQTHATTHYVFKKPTGSEADLAGASATFEQAYARVSGYLGGEYPGTITVYVFPDFATVRNVTGFGGSPDGAFARPLFSSEFHWSPNIFGGHETAHLISAALWGPAGTDFMCEGLAVAADGRWRNNSPHAWARLYRDRLRPIATMVSGQAFYDVDRLVRYPEAGSFVDYVAETCDLEAVRQLWSADVVGFEAAVLDATGKTLAELEAAWRADLAHHLPPFDAPWRLAAGALVVVAAVALFAVYVRRARRRRGA